MGITYGAVKRGLVDLGVAEVGRGQHANVVGRLDRRGRLDRVGNHEFAKLGRGHAGDCAAGKNAMGDIGGDAGRAVLQKRFGRIAERAAAVDDVVDEDAVLAGHVANDIHDFRLASAFATLVDDRQLTVEAFGERTGAHDASDVRRYDHDVVGVVAILHVAGEKRHGIEVVGRDIEEALNLAGMQVEGQHAVGAGFRDQVGDKLGRDRGAGTGLAVLAGIAEVGKDSGDASCRRAAERIDHDQQFHQVIVGGKRCRLDDENVLAAHVFLDFYEDFLVCEPPDTGFSEWYVEIIADCLGELPVRITCENLHFGPPVVMLRWALFSALPLECKWFGGNADLFREKFPSCAVQPPRVCRHDVYSAIVFVPICCMSEAGTPAQGSVAADWIFSSPWMRCRRLPLLSSTSQT